MNKLQACLLATCALVGAAGVATSASAVTCNGDTNCSLGQQAYTFSDNDAFGGGSSLVAPYWRQVSDCYGNPADLITKGSPPTFVDTVLFNWTGTHPQDCSTQTIVTNSTTWYIATGSGSGILAEMTHDPVAFWGTVNSNGPQNFPAANYALSDAGLGSTDLNAYNNGTGGGNYCQGSTCVTIAAPGAESCSHGANPYPNPADCYGPMVQFPFSVDPVAVFYTNGGVYEKISKSGGGSEIDYKLNIQNKTKNGGLRLSVSSLCGIWNGDIKNWNDTRLKQDNNNISLEDPKDLTSGGSWSVPLIGVARSDSSGTTSIITRHLANVCAQFSYNLYTTGATTISGAGAGSIVGNTYNVNNPNYPGVDQAGKLTMAPGSSGVAQYVNFGQAPTDQLGNQCGNATLPQGYTNCIEQSRVGYVGADYILPYVLTSKTNTYKLFGATLQNNAGNWEVPSVHGALVAFNSIQPPQSDSKGHYCSSCLNFGHRNDPTAWVQGLSPSSPLADPTASAAYPIVGTTNFLGYTCYASSHVLSTLTGQLSYVANADINWNSKGILGSQGLSPLPKSWRTAINETFLTNKDGLGLTIATAGSAGLCSGADIVGG